MRLFGTSTSASDLWTLPARAWRLKKGKYRYADKAYAHGSPPAKVAPEGKQAMDARKLPAEASTNWQYCEPFALDMIEAICPAGSLNIPPSPENLSDDDRAARPSPAHEPPATCARSVSYKVVERLFRSSSFVRGTITQS